MEFYILITLIIFGNIISYTTGLTYVKKLRGDLKNNKINDLIVIISSLLFGSIMTLFLYIFSSEIKKEDVMHKYRLLITLISLFVIHCLVIFLLFYFGVVKF